MLGKLSVALTARGLPKAIVVIFDFVAAALNASCSVPVGRLLAIQCDLCRAVAGVEGNKTWIGSWDLEACCQIGVLELLVVVFLVGATRLLCGCSLAVVCVPS